MNETGGLVKAVGSGEMPGGITRLSNCQDRRDQQVTGKALIILLPHVLLQKSVGSGTAVRETCRKSCRALQLRVEFASDRAAFIRTRSDPPAMLTASRKNGAGASTSTVISVPQGGPLALLEMKLRAQQQSDTYIQLK